MSDSVRVTPGPNGYQFDQAQLDALRQAGKLTTDQEKFIMQHPGEVGQLFNGSDSSNFNDRELAAFKSEYDSGDLGTANDPKTLSNDVISNIQKHVTSFMKSVYGSADASGTPNAGSAISSADASAASAWGTSSAGSSFLTASASTMASAESAGASAMVSISASTSIYNSSISASMMASASASLSAIYTSAFGSAEAATMMSATSSIQSSMTSSAGSAGSTGSTGSTGSASSAGSAGSDLSSATASSAAADAYFSAHSAAILAGQLPDPRTMVASASAGSAASSASAILAGMASVQAASGSCSGSASSSDTNADLNNFSGGTLVTPGSAGTIYYEAFGSIAVDTKAGQQAFVKLDPDNPNTTTVVVEDSNGKIIKRYYTDGDKTEFTEAHDGKEKNGLLQATSVQTKKHGWSIKTVDKNGEYTYDYDKNGRTKGSTTDYNVGVGVSLAKYLQSKYGTVPFLGWIGDGKIPSDS